MTTMFDEILARLSGEFIDEAIDGVVCGRGRNPTLRLWPTIFAGEIDVLPSQLRDNAPQRSEIVLP